MPLFLNQRLYFMSVNIRCDRETCLLPIVVRIIDNRLCKINRLVFKTCLVLKNKSINFMVVNGLVFKTCLVLKNKSINFVFN